MSTIISPFNGFFFLVAGIFAVVLIAASILLRKTSEKTRAIVLAVTFIVTLVYFFYYKYQISIDGAYSQILVENGKGEFTWLGELPLQLCNINLILTPIAVLTKKRPLLGFVFFLAPIGALMALMMPAIGFAGYDFFIPRIMGYYITHFVVFFGGIAVASFGLFKPRMKDFFPTVLSIAVIAFSIFVFNTIMRISGVYPHCNYFYLNSTDGNPLLEIFYKIIPCPFLYMLPAVPFILMPYMLLEIWLFKVFGKKKDEDEEPAPVEQI